MEKRCAEAGGYLTLFLTLILTVMMSLCLALITGARESTRRMAAEYVTDIAMNSVLAEYHRELLEQYDLFFVDTTYGTEHADYKNTEEHLTEYAAMNLGEKGIFLSVLYRDPLKMNVDEVKITELAVATDQEGKVLRRQAVEIMLQKIGLGYLDAVSEWLSVVEDYDFDSRDILAEEESASAALMEWDGDLVDTPEGEKEIYIDLPGEEIVSMWKKGVLNFVVEEPEKLSAKAMGENKYVSRRTLLEGTGLPEVIEYEDNALDQLLFHEYLLEYTGRYGQEKEGSFLQYQTEYILCGKPSDLENLKGVANRLLLFRGAADLTYLSSDEEKMQMLKVASELLAVLVGAPELADSFKAFLMTIWAMAEAIYDVEQLLKGNRIPLLKEKKDWHYDLGAIMDFSWVRGSDKGSGLCYADYLRIFLCLQDKKTTSYRLMDIMEMDIRQTPGNQLFRMDACIDSLKADMQYVTRDKKTYIVTRRYGY